MQFKYSTFEAIIEFNRVKSSGAVSNQKDNRTMTEQTLDEEIQRWIKEMLRIASEDREILDALKDDEI